MPRCNTCNEEFYTDKTGGLVLFEGKCSECLSPEQRARLKQELEAKIDAINRLVLEVRALKASHFEYRTGFYLDDCGSLLNAYREGDIDFDECIALLTKKENVNTVGLGIKLYVFHAEGDQTIWKAETWTGVITDRGAYDPLLFYRVDSVSSDTHQLFKLERIIDYENVKSCFYERVPVARDGWFYQSLPSRGFTQIGD